jgi:hypothetical protein
MTGICRRLSYLASLKHFGRGHGIGSLYNNHMTEVTKFRCSNCDAEYKVARVEAPPTANDPLLTCLS